MSQIKDITLANGVKIPTIGLGVYKITEYDDAKIAVKAALDSGYTHFDTAAVYNNEQLIGKAISELGNRKDLFITSKLFNDRHGDAEIAFEETLSKLKTDYLDLYLIHWPSAWRGLYTEAWKTMVKLYNEGKIRAIGVSNFKPEHLEKIIAETGVTPVINQVERHPLFQQKEIAKYCQDRGIVMEAYSPLATGDLAELAPAIKPIADKYGKSIAQIILKWSIQTGWVIIPKSQTPSRIAENSDLFDFELDEQDIAIIETLDAGRKYFPDPDSNDF